MEREPWPIDALASNKIIKARVGLAFVATDVGALGASVHIPVDEARIVAFDIGAIFLELLTEVRSAVIGASP